MVTEETKRIAHLPSTARTTFSSLTSRFGIVDSRSYHRRVGLRNAIRPKTCDVKNVVVLKQKEKRDQRTRKEWAI